MASQDHNAGQFSSMPINIVEQGVKPVVMINASQDHQLYFKAFSDYADLDGDGTLETTYQHSHNYYGYFDSYKCYAYSNNRFEPKSFTTDKYCFNAATGVDNDASKGEWSGNFLNWVAMSRIDSIRKILFGGHRRIDTATETVLERSYLPHDAHSWAKHYAGEDLPKLTPFNPATGGVAPAVGSLDYYCDEGTAYIAPGVVNPLCKDPDDDPKYYNCKISKPHKDCASLTDPYNFDCAMHQQVGNIGYEACKDVSVHDPRYRRDRKNYDPAEDYQDSDWDGTPVNRKRLGVTFGNTTDVNVANYKSDEGSEKYTEPPLIKAVRENYSLWASNERWQVTWASGAPIDNHSASNGNDPTQSLIPAYANSPAWSNRMGLGNYIARVQACVPNLIDSTEVAAIAGSTKEKCKLYPGPDGLAGTADDNYKPIGLLQAYGDDDRMHFGMVAGSYQKHAKGGDLIRNAGALTDEVNVTTDGTFPKVAKFASNDSVKDLGEGMINAWSLYRIVGYDGRDGTYNSLDNCSWGLSAFNDVTADNRCRNWGNPFAEIYYQSINYLAGGGVIGDYRSTVANVIPGLPKPQGFDDPLKAGDYCAQLSVINLNASVISYDHDQLDSSAYGPQKLWDAAVLPGAKNSTAMTNTVGAGEGIHGKSYYVGGIKLGGTGDDQLCTPKTVPYLGLASGLCPEAPRLSGSYRIAGLAYYAHTQDMRPAKHNSRKLEGDQVVDTYSVALASGAPVIEIPDPEDATSKALVTILPACRNTTLNPNGNCGLVDFQIVSQTIDGAGKKASGQFYINWEDSEQGGDFDQDMWGTLDYELDKTAGKLTITTQVHAQSTGDAMAFGYVLGGTTVDGFHAHSGVNGYKYKEAVAPDCRKGCSCTVNAGAHTACDASVSVPSRKVYTLGTSDANLLKDPLWYAAKWGGFTDIDGSKTPNLVEEWDSKINATGGTGSDGIPDNYYYATNPNQLEESLERVFKAILERTSSGTAAAVVSSNVSGEGALYQAYYEPLRKKDAVEARWLGTVQALWMDSYGNSRQDCTPSANGGINPVTGKCLAPPANLAGGVCTPNGRLDNYCVDQVVKTYFDPLEKRTRGRVYESDEPEDYAAYSMLGVVQSFNSGNVVMVPNSMEGLVTYTASPESITIAPYAMTGTLDVYDAETGVGTVTVTDWQGPANKTYSSWGVGTSSGQGAGFSIDSLTPAPGATLTFTVSPVGGWLVQGDTLTFKTKNLIGAGGETFSDWAVECLDPSGTIGEISDVSAQLNNLATSSFSMSTVSGDFSACTQARVSTYDLQGTAGKSYHDWTVTNLGSLEAKGKSATSLMLDNSGSQAFTVIPVVDWLKPGDSILVSNHTFTTRELDEISYLWNAREQLYLPAVSDVALAVNRPWGAPASSGRFITTWVDMNLDKVIDANEYQPFVKTMFNSVSPSFFDVGGMTMPEAEKVVEAENVVNYVRGIEVPGSRNRKVQYRTGEFENVMRLGDIVNSTPAVVGSPQEAFNLMYGDSTYREFLQQYINRRIMVYAGGNDGLIHAFNAGFYNTVTVNANTTDQKTSIEYATTGKAWDGTAATPHPLGAEIWAYAPSSLLTHLQWLKDPEYGKQTHVYFVDGKPRIFDAKIFFNSFGNPIDADHPHGWGTVMVVGMNLGGGSMAVNIDHDNNAATPPELVATRSAYVLFDITNPEAEPRLLAEIPMPDGSFSTVYPAVAAFQDVGLSKSCKDTSNSDTACKSWYLVFGNGPSSLDYVSTQNAKVYLFDLGQLSTKTRSPELTATGLPANCTVQEINPAANLIACDTLQPNSFMGTPAVVDWNLDFRANTAYFGLIGRDTLGAKLKDDGRVMRLGFNNEAAFSAWSPLTTFYDTKLPVGAQPVPSIDNKNNHWLFFGTGRYFSTPDKTTTDKHYLYGVKDMEDSTYPVEESKLLDVSSVKMYTDGTISPSVAPTTGPALNTFKALENEIDANAMGWRMYLEPIAGLATDPSSRSTTRSALLGGVLLSSVFQPSSDPCAGEGQSRLFGLYYKTGTAHPTRSILGTSAVQVGSEVKAVSNKSIDLGQGMATSPSLHSGSGSGSGEVKVLTQLSTGETPIIDIQTINKVRSGRTSWQER
ncbi:MAG: PilC/PilY family type IV pilus protein [Desulfobulbus sp.]|nr:PilC/PilY family type IV pilus protein [Desulfobulbus sp.]